MSEKQNLLNFCRNHKKIYLYGAGRYGKKYKLFLEKNGIHVVGFIVSEVIVDYYCGLPVYSWAEISTSFSKEIGVVLSVKEDTQKIIRLTNSFLCDVFSMKDMDFFLLEFDSIFKQIEKMGLMYPVYDNISPQEWHQILIIQIELTFGDMIWSTALLRELHHNFPACEITLVLNEKMMGFFAHCPYIKHFLPYSIRSDSEYDFSSMDEWVQKNFNKEYDAVFLPRLLPLGIHDLWENVLLALYSKASVRFAHASYIDLIGKAICDYLVPYFSVIVKHLSGQHEAERDLSLLTACGGTIVDDRMELWLSINENKYADKIIASTNLLPTSVLIAIGIVGSNPKRSWPPQMYQQLFRELLHHDNSFFFIICGGEDAKEAACQATEGVNVGCLDLTGKTSLLEVAAIIRKCDLYIGSDTGLMHMAAALGKPIVEISASLPDSPDTYGSSPTRTGPWRVPSVVLRPIHGMDNCTYMCSRDYPHCITQITVDEVAEAAKTLLNIE